LCQTYLYLAQIFCILEIQQTLKDCENSLRDFIALTLERKYGGEWINTIQLNPERIEIWKARKENDSERHQATTTEEHLINYADIDDLRQILLSNWEGDFVDALGDFKTIDVFLEILSRFRNPDIHRRPMLTFQKHLLLGISGDIRNKLTVFRSLQELNREGFPRLESVRDNLGNIWVPGKSVRIKSGMNLHVGDLLEYVVTATDPQDGDLFYSINGKSWSQGNVLTIAVEPRHISKETVFSIMVRSERKFHAFPNGYDDRVAFEYQVFPKEKS
jgi:hypothetical protein